MHLWWQFLAHIYTRHLRHHMNHTILLTLCSCHPSILRWACLRLHLHHYHRLSSVSQDADGSSVVANWYFRWACKLLVCLGRCRELGWHVSAIYCESKTLYHQATIVTPSACSGKEVWVGSSAIELHLQARTTQFRSTDYCLWSKQKVNEH